MSIEEQKILNTYSASFLRCKGLCSLLSTRLYLALYMQPRKYTTKAHCLPFIPVRGGDEHG